MTHGTTSVPGRGRILAGLILVAATLAAYGNSFSGPLVFDDGPSIVANPTIRHLWPLGPVLNPPAAAGQTVGGRPILNLSLALNYAISGTDVWSYHVLNVLIHLLAGLVLFGLVRRTIERWSALSPTRWAAPSTEKRVGVGPSPRLRPARNALHPTAFALAVALLWTLHPLQTEAVTYTIQRAESLMGLFYLLTLYCFVRYVEAAGPASTPPEPRAGRRAWAAAAFLACLLGMATKEIMVTAPVLVFLYDRTFVGGTFGEAWRRRGRMHLALAATWLLLAALLVRTGNRGATVGFGSGVSSWAYAETQFRAIIQYLRLAAWPHPLVFDYRPAWVRSAGEVLPAATAVGLLLLATAWALRRRPVLGFLGCWFFAILAPTSSVVPGSVQTIVEHRMYLPLAALVVLAVLFLFGIVRWTIERWSALSPTRWAPPSADKRVGDNALHRSMVLAVCLPLAAGAALLTHRRNATYRSAVALWADTVAKQRGSSPAHNNLGIALLAAGRADEAVAELRTAVAIVPEVRTAPGVAAPAGFRAEQLKADYYAQVENNLGLALATLGRRSEAVERYQRALRLDPNLASAHENMGIILAQTNQPEAAAGEFTAALRLRPDLAEAEDNLGKIAALAGRGEEAQARYAAALRLDPDYAEAHYNLGNALARSGDFLEAAEHYEAAVRLDPSLVAAQINWGNALRQLGRPAEAKAHYEAALRLDPASAAARENLERLQEPAAGEGAP